MVAGKRQTLGSGAAEVAKWLVALVAFAWLGSWVDQTGRHVAHQQAPALVLGMFLAWGCLSRTRMRNESDDSAMADRAVIAALASFGVALTVAGLNAAFVAGADEVTVEWGTAILFTGLMCSWTLGAVLLTLPRRIARALTCKGWDLAQADEEWDRRG